MSVKDPFQQLVDEITLLRQELGRLKRTSFDKDEAEALRADMVRATQEATKALSAAPERLRSALKADRDQIIQDTQIAAVRAAQSALGDVGTQMARERRKQLDWFEEVERKHARSVRGSWAWFTTALLLGAFLAAMLIYGTESAKTAFGIPRLALIACERIGGDRGQSNDGQGYCVFWDG